MKKLYALILLLICFLCSGKAFAEADFKIKNYEINMEVLPNKTINVNEIVDVYFFQTRRGIIKSILIYDFSSPGENYAKVENVKVNEHFEESTQGYEHFLRIGDPVKRISGDKRYEISYKYKMKTYTNLQKKKLKLEIVGYDSPIETDKVTFKIKMPYPVIREYITIHTGRAKEASNNKITNFTINNQTNTITLISDKLATGEGMTFTYYSPDIYFSSSNDPAPSLPIIPYNEIQEPTSASNTTYQPPIIPPTAQDSANPTQTTQAPAPTPSTAKEAPSPDSDPMSQKVLEILSSCVFIVFMIIQFTLWNLFANKKAPRALSEVLLNKNDCLIDVIQNTLSPNRQTIIAQILSIASRGIIKITKVGSEFYFLNVPEGPKPLPIDEKVLSLCFWKEGERYNIKPLLEEDSEILPSKINASTIILPFINLATISIFMIMALTLTTFQDTHIVLTTISGIILAILLNMLIYGVFRNFIDLFINGACYTTRENTKQTIWLLGSVILLCIFITTFSILACQASSIGLQTSICLFAGSSIIQYIWINGDKQDNGYDLNCLALSVRKFILTKSVGELQAINKLKPNYLIQLIPTAYKEGIADIFFQKLADANIIPPEFECFKAPKAINDFTTYLSIRLPIQ